MGRRCPIYGSAASSTSVTKSFPDWAGPVSSSALGLNLADSSPSGAGDSGTSFGQDFIPIYLARAFYIENKGSLTVANGIQSNATIPVMAAPTLADSSASGNLVPGMTYTYAVTAVLPNGSQSLASPLATHVLGAGKKAITVSWVQSTDAAVSGYNVYRLISGTQYEIFFVSWLTTTSFVDDNMTNGYYIGTLPTGSTGNVVPVITPTLTALNGGCLEAATWTYWVYAYNGTQAIAGTPEAGVPITLSGNNTISVSWPATARATSYHIVKFDGTNYFLLTNVTRTSFLDDALTSDGWTAAGLPASQTGAGSASVSVTGSSSTGLRYMAANSAGNQLNFYADDGSFKGAITLVGCTVTMTTSGNSPRPAWIDLNYGYPGTSTMHVSASGNTITFGTAGSLFFIGATVSGSGTYGVNPEVMASPAGLNFGYPAGTTIALTGVAGAVGSASLVVTGSNVANGGALDAGVHNYVLVTTTPSGVQTGWRKMANGVTVTAGGSVQIILPKFPNLTDKGILYKQPPGSSSWYSQTVSSGQIFFDIGAGLWQASKAADFGKAERAALPGSTSALAAPSNFTAVQSVQGGGSGVYLAFVVMAVDSNGNYGKPSAQTAGMQYGYGAQIIFSWQPVTGASKYVVFYQVNSGVNNWFALPEAVGQATTTTQFTVLNSVGAPPSSSTNPAGSPAQVAAELQAELVRVAPEAGLPNQEVLTPFDNTVFGGHYSADGVYHPTGILDPAFMGILTPLQKQSKYASQTQFEKDALALLAARGRTGDPGIAAGRAYLTSLLSGVILNAGVPSQVTDTMKNRIAAFMGASVLPFMDAKSLYVGDTGPPLSGKSFMQGIAGVEIARLIADVDGENYDVELAYQNDGLRFAIQFGDQYYVDAEALRMSGLLQRKYDHGRLADTYQIYFDNDTLRLRQLAVLGSANGGMVGLRNSITKPYLRPNDALSEVGLAIAAATLAATIMS